MSTVAKKFGESVSNLSLASDRWEIPSDWEVKELGEVCKLFGRIGYRGYTVADIVKKGKGAITLSPSNFNNGHLDLSDCTYISWVKFDESPEIQIENDNILLVKTGSTYGKSAYVINLNEKATINPQLVVIKNIRINPRYLSFLVMDTIFQRQVNEVVVGGAIPTLSQENILKFQIPLPPLPEQHAIASLLTTWDEAIHKTQALITQKELHKKWLMQNLLTGKKRFKGYLDTWIEFRISELFQPVDRYINWSENDQYKLVSLRRRNGGLFFREPLYGHEIQVKKLKEIKRDDFLISKRQVSHGAWAVVGNEFNYGKVSDEYDCLCIQNKEELSVEFWKWYCKLPILTHYAYIDSNGVHIEKSIFDYNQFKKRKVKIPQSISEQTAIAQILQAADTEIQLLKTKVEKLKEQKKGLMQVLLTGKKRLKVER